MKCLNFTYFCITYVANTHVANTLVANTQFFSYSDIPPSPLRMANFGQSCKEIQAPDYESLITGACLFTEFSIHPNQSPIQVIRWSPKLLSMLKIHDCYRQYSFVNAQKNRPV